MRSAEDWGIASHEFDKIKSFVGSRDLTNANEAQTRFDVIDQLVRLVLGWKLGQIHLEEHVEGTKSGYVDSLLRSGDRTLLIEAKRAGASFPSPTKSKKLKLSGSVLGSGPIAEAIVQANGYAEKKHPSVVIVTNGFCWCFYSFKDFKSDAYAGLLFPFDSPGDAEELFNRFSEYRVESGSLEGITNELPRTEDRLLSVLFDSDGRVDRNNIADHILPALNNALYADALLSNYESLRRCFVTTEARTKFDNYLQIHLSDPKPQNIQPARRIKRSKDRDHVEEIIDSAISSHAPPVTLIIGPVGAGKSTYLKHFELISGLDLLTQKRAHWIYIDFEELGLGGNPRDFIYRKLKDYLGVDHPHNATDYKSVVEPAYATEIAGLARGPLAPIFTQKELFNQKVSEHIAQDYAKGEPYVDKVFRFIAESRLCVVVLDNIDLYEDEELEKHVFSEGLALSKRIYCNVFVSIRDTTFVKHKTDSAFDAYELRKLWLDAPEFKAVLSARLTYARKILEGKHVKIELRNGMQLDVKDLSVFFDIVQKSVLQGRAGDFITYVSDSNIRRGLTLVTNFLTSGHIQADRALGSFIKGDTAYYFPIHEVLKGTMLGQWKFYREGRAECINLFDARLGSQQLRLLRLHLLALLLKRSESEQSLEVPVNDCTQILSNCGASENQLIACLENLRKNALIRSTTAEPVKDGSSIVLTRSGAYYLRALSGMFQYVESCLLDTAIDDATTWQNLKDITVAIERTHAPGPRMDLRFKRMNMFLNYLIFLEAQALDEVGERAYLLTMPSIKKALESEMAIITQKVARRFGD